MDRVRVAMKMPMATSGVVCLVLPLRTDEAPPAVVRMTHPYGPDMPRDRGPLHSHPDARGPYPRHSAAEDDAGGDDVSAYSSDTNTSYDPGCAECGQHLDRPPASAAPPYHAPFGRAPGDGPPPPRPLALESPASATGPATAAPTVIFLPIPWSPSAPFPHKPFTLSPPGAPAAAAYPPLPYGSSGGAAHGFGAGPSPQLGPPAGAPPLGSAATASHSHGCPHPPLGTGFGAAGAWPTLDTSYGPSEFQNRFGGPGDGPAPPPLFGPQPVPGRGFAVPRTQGLGAAAPLSPQSPQGKVCRVSCVCVHVCLTAVPTAASAKRPPPPLGPGSCGSAPGRPRE